jgi:hypothetical protein
VNTGDPLEAVARQLALALAPLVDASQDVASLQALMLRLGWVPDTIPRGLLDAASAVTELTRAIEALADDPAPDEVARALAAAPRVYESLQRLSGLPPGIDPAILGERLFELLLVEYLARNVPNVYALLSAIGAIRRERTAATSAQEAYDRYHLDLQALATLVTDPLSAPQQVYGWATPHLDYDLLFQHLAYAASGLRIPLTIEQPRAELRAGYQDAAVRPQRSIAHLMRFPLLSIALEDLPSVVVGVALLDLPSEDGRPPGLILQPLIPSSGSAEVRLSDALSVELHGSSDVASTFGIVIRPNEVSVRYPFAPGTRLPSVGAGIALVYSPPSAQPVIGRAAGSRLELAGGRVGLDVDVRDGELEVRLAAAPRGLAAVISAGEQDGFLGRLLGGAELRVPSTVAFRWSSRTGFAFDGGLGFAIRSRPRLQLAILRVEELELSCTATTGASAGVTASAAISLSAQIGPVGASVQSFGVQAQLRFTPGNAGPFDVALRPRPPRGAGLVIEAGPLTGGGFLDFDPDAGQYAGAIQLRISMLSLTAIGLIATRLPDGRPGFSLLVLVSIEFGAIQLGFGFTLNAVGGLLGIHRASALEPLRAGVRSGSLRSVLFPRDPVRNALRVLSDLTSLFPITEGRHVFGPMVRLGWGTPTVVSIEVGLLLELPSPVRLVLLGRLRMTLPTADAAIALINLDALGIVDFGTGEVSLDASIYDSRVGPFALSGDMALRARFRDRPAFALAIGGFHPRFEPPAGFPELRRVAIALGSGDNPRIRLEAYLALTSNTLQTGARLDLYAAVMVLGTWSVEGQLGFDALIQFSPFHFEVDVYAGVALKHDGAVLFAIDLALRLSGPEPWHAVGEAAFTFLGRHAVHVEVTVGREPPPAELPVSDVAAELAAALGDRRNWTAELPAGPDATIVLRRSRPLPEGEVAAHPLGKLVVRQRVAPLERVITKYGNTRPRDPRAYRITAVALGDSAGGPGEAILDHFAPEQFFHLSDDERLSRPSFELMPAGVQIPVARTVGRAAVVAVEYETVIFDRARDMASAAARHALSLEALQAQAAFGAAGKALTRTTGDRRFEGPPATVTLREPAFTVALRDRLLGAPGVSATVGAGASYTEARAEAERLAAEHPELSGNLHVVGSEEVAA